jgi:hypothetical protein
MGTSNENPNGIDPELFGVFCVAGFAAVMGWVR